MKIFVDTRSRVPTYKQIIQQIEQLVREARQLNINPARLEEMLKEALREEK